jgi:hypothetical protein
MKVKLLSCVFIPFVFVFLVSLFSPQAFRELVYWPPLHLHICSLIFLGLSMKLTL